MKISRDRLIEIIKEEMDQHTRDLYQKDPEEALAITKSEEQIVELKKQIAKLRMIIAGEDVIAGYKGYPADAAPQYPGIIETISQMEKIINGLEINIQASLTSIHQMKEIKNGLSKL